MKVKVWTLAELSKLSRKKILGLKKSNIGKTPNKSGIPPGAESANLNFKTRMKAQKPKSSQRLRIVRCEKPTHDGTWEAMALVVRNGKAIRIRGIMGEWL